jgi:hypothetical protein
MSAWVESSSSNFVARHEERDEDDVGSVLGLLEDTRDRLEEVFPALPPGEVTAVLHASRTELDLAQPLLPIVRRFTTPAARRYVAGWPARSALHVLAPRVLATRATNVEGSREMLLLTPAALYVQLVVAECNPQLPPPWAVRSSARAVRWAWLIAGTGQWFSGQTLHARPAIARRLRENARPDFPPRLRDAPLLGGTVIDLVAREQGVRRAVELACEPAPGGSNEALVATFDGRALVHTEGTWRAHLARLAGR